MARTYAKLYVSVWSSDFRALTREAQHLYFLLVSNPKLSSAGCVVCQPRKWAKYATDCTSDDIADALDELVSSRYVLHDDDTDEVLIRSFIRHDRGFRNQYLRKSIETSVAAIESERLRDVARLELAAAVENAASPQVEDSEQESYEDPSGDSYEDAEQDTCEANYRLQTSPTPSTSPSSPEAGSTDTSDSEPVTPAAAALKMYVDHRMVTDTGIRNPTAYRATLTSTAREDHRAPLRAYLDRRPNASAEELAAHVFAIPGISVAQSEPRRDWYADPTCTTCDGDGWDNTAPEGAPATYGPCDCRRAEPYMATIHELHPTGDVA